MGKWRGKAKQSRKTIHPRQQKMMDLSWQDYLPEDIGTIVLRSLSIGRGVFLGVVPSGELLTLRIYAEDGWTPIYGRGLGELTGRIEKLYGSHNTAAYPADSDRNLIGPAPEYGSVAYMVNVCGWPLRDAEVFNAMLEDRARWVATRSVEGPR